MKVIVSTILVLTTIYSFAQTGRKQLDNVSTQENNTDAYRLFPTQNIWTFIKLNTRNGQMWQVQFNTEEDKRFTTVLSLERLVSEEKEVNNRFTLYPTQNIYTFILLDQFDGKTWQVQWSMDAENRNIFLIE